MIPYCADNFASIERMAISLVDVKRVAHLARLEIDPVEAEQACERLRGIFGLIEAMQAVPTDGVEPMAHAQEMALRLRADQVTEADGRELFQAIAPQVEDGLYLVPKVIE